MTYPDGWQHVEQSGPRARERLTLRQLASGLPADWRIYHHVHWTQVQHTGLSSTSTLQDDIDFIVMAPDGRLFLIEQKSGFPAESEEGLRITTRQGTQLIQTRLTRHAVVLTERLRTWLKQDPPELISLFYCPDYRVRKPGTAGLPPEYIIDASQREQLAARLLALAGAVSPQPAQVAQLHRFLAELLALEPDVSAHIGLARDLYTRLSGGLTEWARRLSFTPFRLRIQGTAGSGKTQLALSILQDCHRSGRSTLYVCYNRPLADSLSRLAPTDCRVLTYHQLARQLAGDLAPANLSSPGAFARLEAFFDQWQASERVDVLIVDEGQDFSPGWRNNLLKFVNRNSQVWWLEDPLQNLYQREEADFSDWVTLATQTTYRCPVQISGFLARLTGRPITSGSPLAPTHTLSLHCHDTPDRLAEQTRLAVRDCLAAGFRRDDIAIITFRGREHSALTMHERLGDYPLTRFTGQYDLLGNPVYRQGDILIESVYRFKGQSAPCIVLTEIDFETLDDAIRRKLFVGASRASMKLVLVATRRACAQLSELISEPA